VGDALEQAEGIVEQAAADVGLGGNEIDILVELYDSEMEALSLKVYDLQQKYSRRAATFENMQDLGKEAVAELLKIGLESRLDWTGLLKEPLEPVQLVIYARAEDSPFDIERQEWEVRHGVGDEWWDRFRRYQDQKRKAESQPQAASSGLLGPDGQPL
jgi:hypothetical protein